MLHWPQDIQVAAAEEMRVVPELDFLQEFQDKVIRAEQPVEQLLDMPEGVVAEQELPEHQLEDLLAQVEQVIHGLIQVLLTQVVVVVVDKESLVVLEDLVWVVPAAVLIVLVQLEPLIQVAVGVEPQDLVRLLVVLEPMV
jgi:hypothetical protein